MTKRGWNTQIFKYITIRMNTLLTLVLIYYIYKFTVSKLIVF
jgi:uncharacterized membrane protein YukC